MGIVYTFVRHLTNDRLHPIEKLWDVLQPHSVGVYAETMRFRLSDNLYRQNENPRSPVPERWNQSFKNVVFVRVSDVIWWCIDLEKGGIAPIKLYCNSQYIRI